MNTLFSVEQIARIVHETNRVYCQTLGDFTQLPWDGAPEWQRRSAVDGVRFHLDAHKRGEDPAPSASHDAWLAEKQREGWKYGPEKDAAKKEHPCIVPYGKLPVEQRMKDYLIASVVAAFAKCESEVGS